MIAKPRSTRVIINKLGRQAIVSGPGTNLSSTTRPTTAGRTTSVQNPLQRHRTAVVQGY
jgi:hypothetical protein